MSRHDRRRLPVPLLPLVAATLIVQACGGGGGGGGGGGALSACREEAASLGIDFDYYQAVGACGPGVEDGFDNGFANTDLLSLPEETPTGDGSAGDDPARGPAPDAAAFPPPATIAVEAGPELADVPGSTFYAGANNSALLQGPLVGNGTVLNGDLARSIPFRVEESPDALALLHTRVVPRGPERSEVIGIVENRSAETHCFVSLQGIVVRDLSGAPVEDEGASFDFAYADGVVGIGATVFTDTCIAPRSRVYVSDGLSVPADEVGSFAVDRIESSASRFELSGTRVEPVAYELDGDRLNVTIANRGLIAVESTFSHVYLIDENGHPVWTSTFTSGSGTLAPGEEGTVSGGVGRFTGQVSGVRVQVDFDPVEE